MPRDSSPKLTDRNPISSRSAAKYGLSVGKMPRGTGYIGRLTLAYQVALGNAVTAAGLVLDIERRHAIHAAMTAERHALYCQWLLRSPDREAVVAARAVRQAATDMPMDDRPSDEKVEQDAEKAAHAAAQQHALSIDERASLSKQMVWARSERNRWVKTLGLRGAEPDGPQFDTSFLPTDDPPADDPPAAPPTEQGDACD